jgi:hypothetical protein
VATVDRRIGWVPWLGSRGLSLFGCLLEVEERDRVAPGPVIWHLLSDRTVCYQDLGPGFYDARVNAERRKRDHVRQLEALGHKVTLEPAA